ncbi:alpha/beta fold hydrolase [Aureimonas leprariae]|uniref:Alpha/beta hydrolase n=1 Tax=Plantimonas leprariae TaxID=2615207 RepID=A0A7V7PQL2_9HYPH|nr:alpha/beta hydrolase [Aureimonas leprariae]KAB0680676.1 alpha/beta hydrolase [Aureimonas leprariae]
MRILFSAVGAVALLATAISSSHAASKVPRPKDSGFAEVNGIGLFYQVYGKGSPLLLIPGGLSNADVWRRQIATLSKHHEVIVADSRGQGRSTRDSTTITYDVMADDYLALMDKLKLRQVALVGWSDGGIIGLDIAIRHPERLTRMFVQAANATPDGAIAYDKAREAGKPVPILQHYDDVAEEIKALWANEPNFTSAELASITVPTMIAIGDHDEAISMDHTVFLANSIPGARMTILPHVGHSAPLEDPAGYAEAVLAFIDAKPDAMPAPKTATESPDGGEPAAAEVAPAEHG